MRKLLARFFLSETGATSIEYALIATLLSVAIIVGAIALGSSLNTVYSNLGSKVTGVTG